MPVKIKLSIPQIVDEVRREVDKVIQETARDLRERIHDDMAQPKHGRVYPTSSHVTGQRTYTASAPGEPPAIVSQSYDASIKAEPLGLMQARVYTGDPRGPKFEFGDGRVSARPHFTPAVEAMREQFYQDVGEAAVAGAAKWDLKQSA